MKKTRIIDLPDDVIRHISSFLTAKQAAHAQIAAKKWRNLISIIPNREFFVLKSKISGSLNDFVKELLSLHANHRLRRFSLKLPDEGNRPYYNPVNDCLRNVLKRGVLDLELDINAKEDYPLPFEVFTCKSVVTLELGSGFVIDTIPLNASLPALKTLILDSVRFDSLDGGCVFQRLLSACSVLEELVINGRVSDHWNWSRTVSSQTLKRLTISREVLAGDHNEVNSEAISFDTPSLEYLENYDVLRDGYPVVNFNSLVEATFDVFLFFDGGGYDLKNLIQGLQNVQILRCVNVDTMLMFDSSCSSEAIPLFENLLHFEVSTEPDYCWFPLTNVLEKSPNLKTLTIEGCLHFVPQEPVCDCLSGYSFLKLCPIETLKITEFEGDTDCMLHIKLILENLPYLELLELHVQARTDRKLQIMSDLLMLPRASSKCKVQVKF
ncbi:F-box protein At3g62430 [Eutrema salsugineum]|nr:F-box protein At3g62430 [Eutrema salsugineum]